VLELNLNVTRGLLPDRTFVLLVDVEESVRRVGDAPDRIEREGGDFRTRVDAAYRQLVELFPRRITAVDGTRPPGDIATLIRDELRDVS
jgi:dTMP kinase